MDSQFLNNDDILQTVLGNIKIIKYNKPKRKNAMDVNMYMKLTNILNETTKDENIDVTVLTGTGDFYSSGNDMTTMVKNREKYNMPQIFKDFIDAFIKFPKVLIAVVNGPAIGIAATTLALCDLVFATENAYFLTPFTKLDLVAEGCSTLTFSKLMGERKAIEMLLFNHKMSAKEAYEHNFVNYLFKPEEIQTKVWNKIEEVSMLPKESLIRTKKLLRSNIKELLDTNLRETKELNNVWQSKFNFNQSKL